MSSGYRGREGFERFTRQQYSGLERYAQRLSQNSHDAQDLVQTTFLYLWHRWVELGDRKEPQLKKLAYMTLKHRHVDLIRRKIPTPLTDLAHEEESEEPEGREPGPDSKVMLDEATTLVLSAIASLHPRYHCIARHANESTARIAADLAVHPYTISRRLESARKKLERSLGGLDNLV